MSKFSPQDLILQLERAQNEAKAIFQSHPKKETIIKSLKMAKKLSESQHLNPEHVAQAKLLSDAVLETIQANTKLPFDEIFKLVEFLSTLRSTSSEKAEKIQIPTTIVEENGDQNSDQEEDDEDELSEEDHKNLVRIQKLDNLCLELHKKIIALEKQEDDLQDENTSSYITENLLKTRFAKAYKLLSKLMREHPHLVDIEGYKPPPVIKDVQFAKKIKVKSSTFHAVNEFISERLNSTREFPEYMDIVEWVKQANEKRNLGLNEQRVQDESKRLIEEITQILRKRRVTDEFNVMKSRIQSIDEAHIQEKLEQDPAKKDPDLADKLSNFDKERVIKEDKLIDDFCKLQETYVETPENEDNDEDEDEEEDGDEGDENLAPEGSEDMTPIGEEDESNEDEQDESESDQESTKSLSCIVRTETVETPEDEIETKSPENCNKRRFNQSESEQDIKKLKMSSQSATKITFGSPKVLSLSVLNKSASMPEDCCIVLD